MELLERSLKSQIQHFSEYASAAYDCLRNLCQHSDQDRQGCYILCMKMHLYTYNMVWDYNTQRTVLPDLQECWKDSIRLLCLSQMGGRLKKGNQKTCHAPMLAAAAYSFLLNFENKVHCAMSQEGADMPCPGGKKSKVQFIITHLACFYMPQTLHMLCL
jgi:hypothetical protein